MKLPRRLSPSMGDTWQSCRRKWYGRYHLKIQDPPGDDALRGTMVHEVLEHLGHLEPGARTNAEALVLARRLWATRPQRLRRVAWEHVVRALRNVEVSHGKVLATEVRLNAVVGGVPFGGIVDRVDELPDGRAAVQDWKGGKRPGRPEWMAPKRTQVALYAAAWRELHPGQPVESVALVWTATGKVDRWVASDALLAGAERWAADRWGEITGAVDAVNGGAAVDDVFPATAGGLCSWCPSLSVCPEGQEAVLERSGNPRAAMGVHGQDWLHSRVVEQMEDTLAATHGRHLRLVDDEAV